MGRACRLAEAPSTRRVPIGASEDSARYLSTKHLHMPNAHLQAGSHLTTVPYLEGAWKGDLKDR